MIPKEWPAYRTVRELVHTHVGMPAVVIGGGESAPASIDECPIDAVHISANGHGFHLRPCQYVVALDKESIGHRRPGTTLVSRYPWADYRILESPAPSSGIAGAWLARLMGCTPIYIVGMDCYRGGTYFHNPTAKSSGKSQSVETHVNRWLKFLQQFGADYRFIGGVMAELVANGKVIWRTDAPSREQLVSEVTGRRVCVVRSPLKMCGVPRLFRAGEVIECGPTEAKDFLQKRMVRAA